MKSIHAIIERAHDGTYSVYCTDEMFSGMGATSEGAKQDMINQMEFFKKTAIEDGVEYPEFLDHDYELVYRFDTKSLLEYYSGILSLSGLEKITGINQKQLWKYLHNQASPRRQQIEKIENGLHKFGNELTSLSLQ